MIKKRVLVLFFLTVLLGSCTPYNSSEKNKELLQGKWLLKEIYYTYTGSSETNLLYDTVSYTFIGDTIIEQVNDNTPQKGIINIKGYALELQDSDGEFVNFQILLLNDSVFSMRSSNNNIWSFEKEKAE